MEFVSQLFHWSAETLPHSLEGDGLDSSFKSHAQGWPLPTHEAAPLFLPHPGAQDHVTLKQNKKSPSGKPGRRLEFTDETLWCMKTPDKCSLGHGVTVLPTRGSSAPRPRLWTGPPERAAMALAFHSRSAPFNSPPITDLPEGIICGESKK